MAGEWVMSMALVFHRDYLMRLPLPLAQLYSRAYNAKDIRSRHDNAFYLLEAWIKLTAAAELSCYIREIEHGAPRSPTLDVHLSYLALPSLGQWVGILREFARHFGEPPDAPSHPLGHLWTQLNRQYRDQPAMLALYRRIKNGPDGCPANDASCSALELIEALVPYRNQVFGHGGPRAPSFYEDVGPLLFPAANELFAESVLDPLGPPGSILVAISEVRTLGSNLVEVGLRELTGFQGERRAPLTLAPEEAAVLLPDTVAVLWPGHRVPLRLDPLLIFRESEIADELLFLNRSRNQHQIEYLSYTTGRTERIAARERTRDGLSAWIAISESATEAAVLPEAARHTGTRFWGDFEILAEIGRGAMGVVYLARQLSLGRMVALKTLTAGLAGDEVALARFRREIRHLAHCDHPHIITVLATGTMPDGLLYYAMEYVPGCDLEQVWQQLACTGSPGSSPSALGQSTWTHIVLDASCRRREEIIAHARRGEPSREVSELSLPALPQAALTADEPGGLVRLIVRLGRDAASALQAVHEQQVIHRDIKPANLMLTADGSRVVLMDFGLAKGESLALSASQQGGFVGSLRYAAPEQLASATLKVGPSADVRALGCVLWELLTRRRLFADAQDEAQLATRVFETDVPLLRSIDPSFDRDLEAIIAQATDRSPQTRIPTAARLAEYLQLYLDGSPLPIRPPRPTEMVGRWLRAHRRGVAVGLGLLGTLSTFALILMAIAGWTTSRTRALGLVQSLENADITRVPALVEQLDGYRRWTDPRLRHIVAASAQDTPGRLRASLGLVPVDPDQTNYLLQKMLSADAGTFLVIREILGKRSRTEAANRLWTWLTTPGSESQRFRAACALAQYAPQDPRWTPLKGVTVQQLLLENRRDPMATGDWVEALEPVMSQLVPSLVKVFQETQSSTDRSLAVRLLLRYDRQVEHYAKLVENATPDEFEWFLAKLRNEDARSVSELKANLSRLQDVLEDKGRNRESAVQRVSQLAIALLRLDQGELIWPLLKAQPDPTLRSWLIEQLAKLAVPANQVVARFRRESDDSVRRALLLGLGGYAEEQLTQSEREVLARELAPLYETDPDPGIHSAIAWLFRVWGFAPRIRQADERLAGNSPGNRRWFVDRQGMPFVIIRPPEESGHPKRAFAIAMYETTVDQYRKFLEAYQDPSLQRTPFSADVSKSADCPINGVAWYNAIVYCRWLSEQAGISADQMCYDSIHDLKRQIASKSVAMIPGFLNRTGYRLPTAAEWELACRAGSVTTRPYGEGLALLPRYAWYAWNSDNEAHPVGLLKPNDLGLFDVLGNMKEWCHDAASPAGSGSDRFTTVLGSSLRELRGGMYRDLEPEVTSSRSTAYSAEGRQISCGLRLVRTWP